MHKNTDDNYSIWFQSIFFCELGFHLSWENSTLSILVSYSTRYVELRYNLADVHNFKYSYRQLWL